MIPSRRARNGLVALFCLGVLLALVPVQEIIHRARPEKFDPTRQQRTSMIGVGLTPALIAAMGGFRPLAADLVWLKADQVWEGGSWWAMLPLLDAVVQLDPKFELAWQVYGWHCAYNLNAESKTAVDKNYWLQRGIEILERAVEANPDSWRMKWELGWTCFDRSHELARAAEWFYAADQLKGAPAYVSRFYLRAYEHLLDRDGILRGLAYARSRYKDDPKHQHLVTRDTNFWQWAWDSPEQHRRIIVEENTARFERGIPPYLYPNDRFFDVCPVCGMPVPKSKDAVCGNVQCPNYKHPIHQEPAGGVRSAA